MRWDGKGWDPSGETEKPFYSLQEKKKRGVTVMYGRERKREKDDDDDDASKSGYRNRELHLQREDHSFTQTDTYDVNAYLSLLVRGEVRERIVVAENGQDEITQTDREGEE